MSRAQVTRLTGVYHADGGVRGELTYVYGRLRGTAHCGLCDITHSGVRRKREWDAFVSGLSVPFDAVHLNERSEAVREATEGRTPCVVAHTEDGLAILVPAAVLDRTGGDVSKFAAALAAGLDAHALTLA